MSPSGVVASVQVTADYKSMLTLLGYLLTAVGLVAVVVHLVNGRKRNDDRITNMTGLISIVFISGVMLLVFAGPVPFA